MSWLALLLVGVAVCDLAFSVRPVRYVPEALGAAAAVGLGLLAGLTRPVDLAALLVIAVVVVAWGWLVPRAFARGPGWGPLVLLGVALVAGVLVSPWAGRAGGVLADWLAGATLPVLTDQSPDRLLVLLGVLLLQLSTGNVLVRLVLQTTRTLAPPRRGAMDLASHQLKGGRLLGPLERLLLVLLVLAGQVTAASVVVLAKGLLRFPELSSRREQEQIHHLTEYFLVGSFVSWTIAAGSVLLVGVEPGPPGPVPGIPGRG